MERAREVYIIRTPDGHYTAVPKDQLSSFEWHGQVAPQSQTDHGGGAGSGKGPMDGAKEIYGGRDKPDPHTPSGRETKNIA
jgi:hypothetical protein